MVLMPCGSCCKPCPDTDSNGLGTYFEDFFDYDNQAEMQAAGWSIVFGTPTFGSGVSFATRGSILRTTYLDLSSDLRIEIEATETMTRPTVCDYNLCRVQSWMRMGNLCFAHRPKGPEEGFSFSETFRLFDAPVGTGSNVVWSDSNTGHDFGLSDIEYKATFEFIDGMWTAAFSVNGTSVFPTGQYPDLQTFDVGPCFAHGITNAYDIVGAFGDEAGWNVSRYYMKLTYL